MTDPTPEPTDNPDHNPVVTETPEPKVFDLDTSEKKRMIARRWVLRITLGLTILSPLVFILAGFGAKFGLWSWQFGLGTLTREVGPVLLIATLVAGLIALAFALLIKPRKGIVIAVFAIIIPIAGFANLKATQAKVASLPLIHDITTDTQDPPVFGATIMAERNAVKGVNTIDYAGKRAPTRQRDANGEPVTKLVSALQTQAYPEIRTLVLSEAPDVVFGRVEQVARDMGWAIKDSDSAAGSIEATATTFWYGFEDDISIRLRPAQGDGTRVDVRSISRVGLSDIGANAARVKKFLDALAN